MANNTTSLSTKSLSVFVSSSKENHAITEINGAARERFILAGVKFGIAYGSLHGPLTVQRARTQANDFWTKVSEFVNALANEMDSFGHSLEVQRLKLRNIFDGELMGANHCLRVDFVLVEASKDCDAFAKVSPVIVGKYADEESGKESDNVQQKLPSFISARDFFCWISWWSAERTGQIWRHISYSLTMLLPQLAHEHSPVPRVLGVRLFTWYRRAE
ncbi:hypothetical protein C8R45DRAFT_1011362 [Mycena sanguinolenta]|nr:hypothetical protein C8R45DRAFT_1011362 [Mycena sanguinolenta]